MSTYRKFFPHLVTLLFAFGLPLVSAGQVLAQTPCNDATPPISFIVKPNHPTTGDAQLIFHLFASYSWALDDRRDQDFVDLFTAKAIYEVCRSGGAQPHPDSENNRQRRTAEIYRYAIR